MRCVLEQTTGLFSHAVTPWTWCLPVQDDVCLPLMRRQLGHSRWAGTCRGGRAHCGQRNASHGFARSASRIRTLWWPLIASFSIGRLHTTGPSLPYPGQGPQLLATQPGVSHGNQQLICLFYPNFAHYKWLYLPIDPLQGCKKVLQSRGHCSVLVRLHGSLFTPDRPDP